MTNPNKDTIILCDIGGTHARIGYVIAENNDKINEIEKYKTTEFADLSATLNHYLSSKSINVTRVKSIYIASAVRPINGIVQFDTSYKATGWTIAPDIVAQDFNLNKEAIKILLDTEAQFLALESNLIEDNEIIPLKDGLTDNGEPQKLLISIGTGLGHAFGNIEQQHFTPTYGGHMPALANNQQQQLALNFIQKRLSKEQFIFEDVVSGQGFYNLYLYSCDALKAERQASDIYDLASKLNYLREQESIKQAAQLFSSFLGLYIHLAALFTHSYNSCTLIGGLARTLHEEGLLCQKSISDSIELDMVKVVKNSLKNMPVSLTTKPHLSLYGLLYAHNKERQA